MRQNDCQLRNIRARNSTGTIAQHTLLNRRRRKEIVEGRQIPDLRQNIIHDLPVHVGQSKPPSLIFVGQPLVIDS